MVARSKPRTGLALLAVLATALTALPATAASADPAGSLHHVYRTNGDGVWLHAAPVVNDQLLTVLPEATEFLATCWKAGETVNGNNIWLYGTSGQNSGYVTDYYIDTHWNTTADLDAQGIPACDAAPAPDPAPAPDSQDNTSLGYGWPGSTAPVNIQLLVNGTREQNLLALTDELQAAADATGIDGQELARVIDHEGGQYLDNAVLRDSWELVEEAWPYPDPSVGIAQMKVSTARTVDAQVYGTDDSSVSNEDMRYRLIHDQNFSIFMAAGYLQLMQNEGVGDGWPQFMAYSLSPKTALAWELAGHPMDTASLKALDIIPESFQPRQQLYNDAVAAIG